MSSDESLQRARGAACLAALVGQRQQQHHGRGLVVRVDLEHVEADALGLVWLVQQAVAFRLRER